MLRKYNLADMTTVVARVSISVRGPIQTTITPGSNVGYPVNDGNRPPVSRRGTASDVQKCLCVVAVTARSLR